MSTNSTLTTVSPKALRRHAFNCINSRTPVFVWGNPGIGKSQILEALAKSLGYHFEDVRLSQIESIDLRGLPFKEHSAELDRTMVDWAMPDFLTRSKEAKKTKNQATFFFFDELNSGSQATMAAAYQLINDRRIGKFTLEADDVIFAAGNLETDGGITNQMPTPLANRFRHYQLVADTDQWLDWASLNSVHPWVLSYLSNPANKSKLHTFNVDEIQGNIEKAFGTPRTWIMVSRSLFAAYGDGRVATPKFEKELDSDSDDFGVYDEELSMKDSDMGSLVASCVGSGVATDFAAYVKEGMGLDKAEDILAGKITKPASLKDKPSAQFFIASGCSHLLREIKNKMVEVQKEKGDKSDDFKKLALEYNKKIENYVIYAKENFARELFVYGVINVMLKRYKVIPNPTIMDPKVFDLFNKEFQKTKTTA